MASSRSLPSSSQWAGTHCRWIGRAPPLARAVRFSQMAAPRGEDWAAGPPRSVARDDWESLHITIGSWWVLQEMLCRCLQCHHLSSIAGAATPHTSLVYSTVHIQLGGRSPQRSTSPNTTSRVPLGTRRPLSARAVDILCSSVGEQWRGPRHHCRAQWLWTDAASARPSLFVCLLI